MKKCTIDIRNTKGGTELTVPGYACTVEGFPVVVHRGLATVRNAGRPDTLAVIPTMWQVSEPRTGSAMTRKCDTRKEALELAARSILRNRGAQGVEAAVQATLARFAEFQAPAA